MDKEKFKQLETLSRKVVSQVSRYTTKPILIVEARFYDDFADQLFEGAAAVLDEAALRYQRFEVPGVFEIPAAISMALSSKKYSGFIALGCVIRGETTHYDYVCNEAARGLMEISFQAQVPVGFGVITAENRAQALVRADKAQKDMGGKAARAVIRMIEAKKHFSPKR
jgi:6,7-dimethyl-8-ribityllumazine synthase